MTGNELARILDPRAALHPALRKVAELRDVGPVSFPAYPDSSAAQRSLDAWKQAQNEGLEARGEFARDARERLLNLIDL